MRCRSTDCRWQGVWCLSCCGACLAGAALPMPEAGASPLRFIVIRGLVTLAGRPLARSAPPTMALSLTTLSLLGRCVQPLVAGGLASLRGSVQRGAAVGFLHTGAAARAAAEEPKEQQGGEAAAPAAEQQQGGGAGAGEPAEELSLEQCLAQLAEAKEALEGERKRVRWMERLPEGARRCPLPPAPMAGQRRSPGPPLPSVCRRRRPRTSCCARWLTWRTCESAPHAPRPRPRPMPCR